MFIVFAVIHVFMLELRPSAHLPTRMYSRSIPDLRFYSVVCIPCHYHSLFNLEKGLGRLREHLLPTSLLYSLIKKVTSNHAVYVRPSRLYTNVRWSEYFPCGFWSQGRLS